MNNLKEWLIRSIWGSVDAHIDKVYVVEFWLDISDSYRTLEDLVNIEIGRFVEHETE